MAEKTQETHRREEVGGGGGSSPSVIIDGRDDESKGDDRSASESSMAGCLSSLISSIIQEFDSRAEETLRSQDQLSFALDRLTGELDQLLDAAPLPFMMQHAARISSVRKRVASLNSVLKSIQRRVDNIDRMLSSGSTLHEQGKETWPQH